MKSRTSLKARVISEAVLILENEGESAISLRRIARQIGVSHQAPYKHFANKQDILREIQLEGFAKLAAATEKTANCHPRSRRKQLQSAAVEYVLHATNHPAIYNLMFGGRFPYGEWPEHQQTGASQAFNALAAIVSGQTLDAYPIATVKKTRFVWSMMHGIASLRNSGFLQDEKSIDSYVKSAINLVFSQN